jgi:hypothetical protein
VILTIKDIGRNVKESALEKKQRAAMLPIKSAYGTIDSPISTIRKGITTIKFDRERKPSAA